MPDDRPAGDAAEKAPTGSSRADLSSLSSMLQARWKGGASGGAARPQDARIGQIMSFRISKLDAEAKKIELEPA